MSIIVTGASSGIGKEICLKLLEQNFQVIGISRDFTKCDIDHPLFKSYSIDLSDLKTLPRHLKEISLKHPQILGLVLSAGYGLFGYLEQLSFCEIQKLFDVNFFSSVLITKTFLPQMKKNQKGILVFIGSEASLQGKAQGSIYCASKFALRGFTQALRQECAKNNLHVSLINPGMVKTPFFDHLYFAHGQDPANYCLPEEIAQIVVQQFLAREGFVLEEINLSPLKTQVQFKHQNNGT